MSSKLFIGCIVGSVFVFVAIIVILYFVFREPEKQIRSRMKLASYVQELDRVERRMSKQKKTLSERLRIKDKFSLLSFLLASTKSILFGKFLRDVSNLKPLVCDDLEIDEGTSVPKHEVVDKINILIGCIKDRAAKIHSLMDDFKTQFANLCYNGDSAALRGLIDNIKNNNRDCIDFDVIPNIINILEKNVLSNNTPSREGADILNSFVENMKGGRSDIIGDVNKFKEELNKMEFQCLEPKSLEGNLFVIGGPSNGTMLFT